MRASQKLGMPVRLRNLIPCNAKLMLYKTSVLPYLTHSHSVWKICKSTDKSQTEEYEELLNRAKLPTPYNKRLQDIAILMYKIKYRMAHRCVSELFTIKSRHQSLRNCELPRFDIVGLWQVFPTLHSVQRTFHLVKGQ